MFIVCVDTPTISELTHNNKQKFNVIKDSPLDASSFQTEHLCIWYFLFLFLFQRICTEADTLSALDWSISGPLCLRVNITWFIVKSLSGYILCDSHVSSQNVWQRTGTIYQSFLSYVWYEAYLKATKMESSLRAQKLFVFFLLDL